MMKTENGKFVNFIFFLIIAVYIASYFLPEHYGVKCTEHAAPMGCAMLCVIYVIWTCFTVHHIKNDPLLKTKEHSYHDLWDTTKRLCLKEYEGEYDHESMILA